MKMEHDADSFCTPVSQGHVQFWTEDEIDLLTEMSTVRCTKDMIRKAFPNRTLQAVKMKLYEIRRADHSRELKGNGDRAPNGVNPLNPDDPGVDDGWFNRNLKMMMQGNKAFLAALPRAYA